MNKKLLCAGACIALFSLGTCVGAKYSSEIEKTCKTSANYFLDRGEGLIERTRGYINNDRTGLYVLKETSEEAAGDIVQAGQGLEGMIKDGSK